MVNGYIWQFDICLFPGCAQKSAKNLSIGIRIAFILTQQQEANNIAYLKIGWKIKNF